MAKRLGNENTKASQKQADADLAANVTRETFLEAVQDLNSHNEKVKAANAARQAARKKWKANGITLGHLDRALRMSEWEREEQAEWFETEKTYAKWLGLRTGDQGDLFNGMQDDEVQAREWNAKGYTAALTGKPASPPDDCPPMFHPDWKKGFTKGVNQDFEEAAPPEATAEPTPKTEDDLDRLKKEQQAERKADAKTAAKSKAAAEKKAGDAGAGK